MKKWKTANLIQIQQLHIKTLAFYTMDWSQNNSSQCTLARTISPFSINPASTRKNTMARTRRNNSHTNRQRRKNHIQPQMQNLRFPRRIKNTPPIIDPEQNTTKNNFGTLPHKPQTQNQNKKTLVEQSMITQLRMQLCKYNILAFKLFSRFFHGKTRLNPSVNPLKNMLYFQSQLFF